MRKGHNPNREQKELLVKNKKDWKEWLLVKTEKDAYVFKHKTSNELLTLYSNQ